MKQITFKILCFLYIFLSPILVFSQINCLENFDSLTSQLTNEDQNAGVIDFNKHLYDLLISSKTTTQASLYTCIESMNDSITKVDSFLVKIHFEKGKYHYDQYEDHHAKTSFEKSISLLKNTGLQNSTFEADLYFRLGKVHLFLGALQAAKKCLQHASRIYQNQQNEELLIDCQLYLADVYFESNDLEKAENLYLLIISTNKKETQKAQEQLAQAYKNLGLISVDKGNYVKADKYLRIAIAIYEKREELKDYLANTYADLAEVYIKTKEYNESILILEKAMSIKKTLHGETHKDYILLEENLGMVYKYQYKYSEALKHLKNTLVLNQNNNNGKKSLSLNRNYHNLGTIYLHEENFFEALLYFQKAIQQQLLNFNNDDIFSNPKMDDLELIGSNSSLLLDLSFKAKTFYQWYQLSQNPEHLKAAYDTYQTAIRLIDLLRGNFTAKGSKLFWLKETFPIFEKSILVATEMYELTEEEKYQQSIWTLMESNKAILIVESLNTSRVELFTDIPDSIREHQQFLISSINQQERAVIDLKQDSTTKDSLLKSEEAELAQFKIQQFELEDQLKNNYFNYYQLTRNTERPTVASIQQQITDHQAFLEYFYGDSTVYLLLIAKEQCKFFSIEKLGLENINRIFHNQLSNPETKLGSFQEIGFEAYQNVLQNALVELSPSINELIIIPDGELASIPFEAFVSKKNQQATSFADLHYLHNDYTITYALSATLLAKQLEQKANPSENSFIGFAPSFQGTRSLLASRTCDIDSLTNLQHSETEVIGIANLLNGHALIGEQANKSTFLDQCKNSRILHLATHACIDDQQSDQSRIYLADDYFYLQELYNLDLSAEMVVLSACETGVGAYQKGEGIISLAHGFTYAGVPSTTMSLWAVNDATTAQLMQYYYQHIQLGKSKHTALRQAKLDYLNNQESLSQLHPYYWAGFVHLGNYKAIELDSNEKFYLWVLVAIILLVLIVFSLLSKLRRA